LAANGVGAIRHAPTLQEVEVNVKKQACVIGAAGSAALLAPVLGAPAAHAAVSDSSGVSQPVPSARSSCAPRTAVETASTHLVPRTVKHLGDGGAVYVYQLGSHQLTFPIPPAGFNPFRATVAELAQYGLPPQPTNLKARAQWTRLLAALGHVKAPNPSVRAALPNALIRSTKPPKPGLAYNEVDSDNWAGYVSDQGQSTYYTNVQATWTQPSTSATSCSNANHVTWVGIGGYNGSTQLLQDGTDQNNQPWFEYLGPSGSVPSQIFPNNITINSGDTVLAGTAYTPNQAWFLLQDQTTGQSTEAGLSSASSFYDGSSVEFIDERNAPCQSCNPDPLADYGTTSWSGAEAATGNGYKNAASTLPGLQYLNMYNQDSTNDLLAAVSGGSNSTPDSFQTLWKNCS
jgi:hypothetical protein